MIRYYLLTFARNLVRQRVFATINLLGLTTGIVASMLIYIYVQHELSHDKFHKNADRIVRVNQTFIWGQDNDQLFSSTGPGVANAIAAEIPEAVEVTRVHPPGNSLMTYITPEGETKSFDQDGILAVDSNFFKVFTFDLLKGNPETALREVNTLVITASTAKKYFGDEDPIGKLIEVGNFITDQNKKTFEVTGVVADPPSTSYIDFDILLSIASFPRVKTQSSSWVWTMFETFALLDKNASIEAFEQKLSTLPRKYAEKTLQNAMGTTFDQYTAGGKQWNLYAQPLTSIHLHSGTIYNRVNDVGSITIVYVLSGIVIVILLLSCINFMNLSTAQYTRRAKESSLRKVLGSSRFQIGFTFFVEAMLYCMLSLVAAMAITQFMLPFFNDLTANSYSLNVLFTGSSAFLVVGLLVMMSLICGSYPALFMTRFNPIEAIKGKLKTGREGKGIRNALVVFQFAISLVLIVGTIVVFYQMKFLSEKETGFNRENLLVVNRLEWVNDKETFIDALKSINGIRNASWCTSAPPKLYDGDGFTIDEKQGQVINLNYVLADPAYAQTLELSFVVGRNFSDDRPSDTQAIILNETAVHEAGWLVNEEVLGKRITYPGIGQTFEVIGVVRDFNYWSLQAAIQPMALFNIKGKMYYHNREYATIRIDQFNQEEWNSFITAVHEKWKTFAGDAPFQYEFVDQAFDESFQSEKRFGQTLSIFAGLAIMIACLGLLGMIIFTLELRTKEIGIRKVIGASTPSILLLVSRDYLKLIAIAVLIGGPLSLFVVNKWLENFLYRINPGVEVIAMAAGSIFIVATLITVYHCIKAAQRNPVEVLKDE